MFQRFRLAATAALLVGFATSVSCSPADDEGDGDSFDGDGGSNASGSNSTGSGGTANSGSGNSSSGGASSGTSSSTFDTAAATTGMSSSTTGSGSGGMPSIGTDLPSACPGVPYDGGFEEEACVGTGYEAENLPVDLLLMVDTSTSMVDHEVDGFTRWQLVSDAVKDFVQDPSAQNIGMGIHFWSWLSDSDCSVDQYSTPTVPIGNLGDISEDIVAAIDDQSPGGLTPTYPALAGAIEYAKGYAADNPARQAVVVFVTDGYPTKCEPTDVTEIASLAEDAWLNEPHVATFVVGIDGTYNLDQIARAGGTREAFNVENDGSTGRLVTALKNITTDSAQCEFEIPEPDDPEFESVDPERVQVIYEPNSGDPQEIPKVSSYSACLNSPNGGWYFGGSDANGNPTKVVVCPCSCANFAAGSVQVALGCKATPVLE